MIPFSLGQPDTSQGQGMALQTGLMGFQTKRANLFEAVDNCSEKPKSTSEPPKNGLQYI
jgi:hypothetical protein